MAVKFPRITTDPSSATVSGYVIAEVTVWIYPNFHDPAGVVPLVGNTSVKNDAVRLTLSSVSHAVPLNRRRGEIWTGTPEVAAVVFCMTPPSVDVVTNAPLVPVNVENAMLVAVELNRSNKESVSPEVRIEMPAENAALAITRVPSPFGDNLVLDAQPIVELAPAVTFPAPK